MNGAPLATISTRDVLVAQALGSFFLEGTLSSNVTINSPMQPQITTSSSGERAMKSSVAERSMVSLEDAFWKGLQEIIVERHDEPLSDRQFANLSSAIRLFALGFYGDEQGGRIA
jgi:predicted DNA-binding ribbon-helix-helix protein